MVDESNSFIETSAKSILIATATKTVNFNRKKC